MIAGFIWGKSMSIFMILYSRKFLISKMKRFSFSFRHIIKLMVRWANLDKQLNALGGFEEIMNRYGEDVTRLIYGYVKDWPISEDLTQEVFINIYHHLEDFEGRSQLKTWIFSIAINKTKDYMRSWHYKKQLITNNFFYLQDPSHKPDQQLINREANDELIMRVFKLPIKYREVILLHYYQELKLTEISQVINKKPETVRTRLFRAKKLLKEIIGGHIEDE
jgi:RNA polymerase sigma-70 factor, ECF subfamily